GGPFAILTPKPERRRDTVRPWETSGPGGSGDSGGSGDGDPCANPAGRRRGAAARRDCPRPTSSISTIPQDGPGESPPPTATDPATPTATGT
ncbi:MAG: hypothetical protein HOQ38_06830, partial [Nonomuraea sp.]|nr:hypothetical protein [Nonomuraea sp.]